MIQFGRLATIVIIFSLSRIEIAWTVITDILSEMLESKDVMDELADIREKKRKATLEQRRSFFVRMVSDPAIQPGFTKTPNQPAKLETQMTIGGIGSNPSTSTYVLLTLVMLMFMSLQLSMHTLQRW